ncbi:DUF2478 domain-containing protein [Achromobacter denitrificans]
MDCTETPVAIAAIVHSHKAAADAPLLEFVRGLQSQGLAVRGLVSGPPDGQGRRTVLDLERGALYPIDNNPGQGQQACCLDPGTLLAAGVVLRRAMQGPADLVIVNRFGALEAEGGGFSAEMLELMAGGYPLLTVVSPVHLDAWRKFTGGMASELAPDVDAMLNWLNETVRKRTPLSPDLIVRKAIPPPLL